MPVVDRDVTVATDSMNALDAARAVALYVFASSIVTWPLVLNLGTHLPLGTLGVPTVPWFNLWSLAWNADRFAHGLAGYWDAPIFFPRHDTFALSEPQAATGLVFWLLQALSGPIAAYNGVVILALALNGIAARHLLRVSGVARRAATLGGLLAVASSFAIKELGVVQLLAMYAPLFAIAELCRVLRAESGAVFVRLALWCALTLWTCIYYALLLAPFVVLAIAVATCRHKLRLRPYASLAVALAIGLCAASPLLLVQRRALSAQARSAEVVRRGSASLAAYLRLPAQSLGARLNPLFRAKPNARALYPGSALLLLAGVGAWRLRRTRERGFGLFCAAACMLALVLSCGTRWSVAGLLPYEWAVQRLIPGFAQLRSPYRFAAFVHMFLLPLAGLGLESMLAWSVGRRLLAHAIPLLLGLALLEGVAWPEPLHRFPVEQVHAPWVEWLRAQPEGAVAMVPPERSGRMEDFELVTLAMLQSLSHHHPMWGGYSGFFPSSNRLVAPRLRAFPALATQQALQRARVRYVVVDAAWLDAFKAASPSDPDPTRAWPLIYRSADKLVYGVPSTTVDSEGQ
jgi:hypothetical protein